jgi:hypothetical protein
MNLLNGGYLRPTNGDVWTNEMCQRFGKMSISKHDLFKHGLRVSFDEEQTDVGKGISKSFNFWSCVATAIAAAETLLDITQTTDLIGGEVYQHLLTDVSILTKTLNSLVCNSVWSGWKAHLKSIHEYQGLQVYHDGKLEDMMEFRKTCGYEALLEKYVRVGVNSLEDVLDRISDQVFEGDFLFTSFSFKCSCKKYAEFFDYGETISETKFKDILLDGSIIAILANPLSPEFRTAMIECLDDYIEVMQRYEHFIYISHGWPGFHHTPAMIYTVDEETKIHISFIHLEQCRDMLCGEGKKKLKISENSVNIE